MEDHLSFPPSSYPPPTSPRPFSKPSAPPLASDFTNITTSTSSNNKDQDTVLQTTNMEVDAALALSTHQKLNKEEQNIPIQMDEEPESVDLGGLDILRLETACQYKEFSVIPPGKSNILKWFWP